MKIVCFFSAFLEDLAVILMAENRNISPVNMCLFNTDKWRSIYSHAKSEYWQLKLNEQFSILNRKINDQYLVDDFIDYFILHDRSHVVKTGD